MGGRHGMDHKHRNLEFGSWQSELEILKLCIDMAIV